jgi:xanthosine utilization system XapX-like protein
MFYRENSNIFRYIQLFALALLLFISGLQIPSLSNLSFFLIIPLALTNDIFGLPRLLTIEKIFKKEYILLFFTLASFAIIYFLTLEYYEINGIDQENKVWINIFRFLIYYIIGIGINYSRLPYYPYNLVLLLLSLISGSTIFIFLSVNKVTFGALAFFKLEGTEIPNVWGGDDLHIRNVDMFSSLNMGLFPLLLYGRDRNFKSSYIDWFITILLIPLFLLSLYSSLALRGRTPLMVLVASLTLATIFILFKSGKSKLLRKIWIFMLISISVIAFVDFAEIWNLVSGTGLLERFESEGLDTPRYEMWNTVLEKMFDYPFGGKKFKLVSEWAHNLWLDTVYEAGIIPSLLLIIFQLIHLKAFIKVFSSALPRIVSLAVIGITIGFALTFMIQPIMAASTVYFAISCFFLGVVKRLAEDLEIYAQQQRILRLNSYVLSENSQSIITPRN